MNRCPENDKILLFCEHELSDVERSQFELHLKTCAECRRELEQTVADDALLRAGIDEAFARHRVSNRIMAQIRNEKTATPVADSHKGWRYFWLTAFALLTIITVVSLYTPTPAKYHGRVGAVMLQALNEKSMLQSEKLAVDQVCDLATVEPAKLDGCFLFTVTSGQTSVFKMSGQAIARINQGLPEFTDAKATFELVSGAIITILVNGSPLKLERKTIIPAPFNTSDLAPDRPDLPSAHLPSVASTSCASDAIIDCMSETPCIIDNSAANASAATPAVEAVPGSATWVDPTQPPGKNPFADEPLKLDGN
ncbi:MAG: hypothetical protein CVV42_09895 [Candidatus Riflebacteria bacterium HGW-Riflebacteria-2]|jgi:hypothetical protein|nr:MAG: hypothetical protein CVV42_09895 [Candidatus Riflebacteria bacterium HGW-Riflebacteria-2]